MSFTTFLAQVGKIAVGYGGAVVMIGLAVAAASYGYTIPGIILGILGFIAALFGAYSERGL